MTEISGVISLIYQLLNGFGIELPSEIVIFDYAINVAVILGILVVVLKLVFNRGNLSKRDFITLIGTIKESANESKQGQELIKKSEKLYENVSGVLLASTSKITGVADSIKTEFDAFKNDVNNKMRLLESENRILIKYINKTLTNVPELIKNGIANEFDNEYKKIESLLLETENKEE